ncbi:LysM peptidoglycan-binding domain-containing protein [Paenibacillus daejeonensis]|uniref:LysM peptidoglycan-binding domain-containing protein n=1 Tax=Paenibacillus daejeonensis TaxID=135193 RepID=UPI000382796D|nr:LysM domain-containing protein [Paenibacillus daejeonensis]
MSKNKASTADARGGRTTFYVLLSLLGFLLVVCAVLYSIYLQQAGTALSQTNNEDTELAEGSLGGEEPTEATNDPSTELWPDNGQAEGMPREGEDPMQEIDAPGIDRSPPPEEEPSPDTQEQPNESVSPGNGFPATYLVQPGDTLYSISRMFYNSPDYVDLIVSRNNLGGPDGLRAGANLTIPSPKNGGGGAQAPSSGGTSGSSTESKTHTVREGETLFSLSRQYYGDNSGAKRIAAHNGLAEDHQLRVGEVVRIP